MIAYLHCHYRFTVNSLLAKDISLFILYNTPGYHIIFFTLSVLCIYKKILSLSFIDQFLSFLCNISDDMKSISV